MPDSPDKISITICGDGGCGAFNPLVKTLGCWRWLMVTRQILHDSAIGTQSMDSRVSGLC